MSLLEQALLTQKIEILEELEVRIWERLEPRIQQELLSRIMSIIQTAEYLHVSEQTIRRLIREKEIPSFKVRHQIFIRLMDVDSWIEKQLKEGDKHKDSHGSGENAGVGQKG
jgi:excisionase family DNA binding protein